MTGRKTPQASGDPLEKLFKGITLDGYIEAGKVHGLNGFYKRIEKS